MNGTFLFLCVCVCNWLLISVRLERLTVAHLLQIFDAINGTRSTLLYSQELCGQSVVFTVSP